MPGLGLTGRWQDTKNYMRGTKDFANIRIFIDICEVKKCNIFIYSIYVYCNVGGSIFGLKTDLLFYSVSNFIILH